MNRKLLITWFVGAAYALSGCGDEAGGQEPGSSVERLVEYLNEGRRQDAKELFSGAMQAEFEAGLFEELSTAVTRNGRVTGIEVRDERIEGTKATVLIRISYLDQQPPDFFVPKLVYQDGMWRLDDFRVNELRDLTEMQLGPLAVSEGGDLYLATGSELHRSTNRGETWSSVGPRGEFVTALATTGSGAVLAGTSRGLFRTLDRGDSWTKILSISEPVESLAVSEELTVIVGTYDDLHISTDNGSTWSVVGVRELLAANVPSPKLVVSPSGSILIVDYLGFVHRSNDNGSTWLRVLETYPRSLFAHAVAPSGAVYVAGQRSFFRSIDDGVSWHQGGGGVSEEHNIVALTSDSDGHVFALTHLDLLFRSPDRGESFSELGVRLQPGLLQAVVIGEDHYLFAESVGHLVRSSDGGDTWTDVASKDDFRARSLFARPL